jgi:acyl-CoA thioesterase
MTSLAQIIQSFSASEAFDTPPNWHQGRTIYGGLSAALALEAALQTAPPDLPPLKSAQILFVGPALNGLHFKAQTLRQGKSATMIAVDGMAEGQLILRVAFLFAHPRVSAVQHDLSCRPLVQPPEACISLHETGPTPIHLSNFEVRMAGPHLPVTGGDHPELLAWVRHKDASGVDPAVALLALGDGLPPGVMVCFKAFAPISSMTWNLDLAAPAALGDWFLLRSTSQRGRDGYSVQTMDIWREDGPLVLSGHQTVAVFV